MAKRFILEIGHGGNAVPTRMRSNNVKLQPHDVYVGVDAHNLTTDSNAILADRMRNPAAAHLMQVQAEGSNWFIDLSRKEIPELRKFHENQNISFVSADGRTLPFKDNAFHDVHLHNVITQPIFDVNPKVLQQILQEAHRVMKPGGHLIVVTDLYPGQLKVPDVVCKVHGFQLHVGENAKEKMNAIKTSLTDVRELRSIHIFVKKN